MTGSTRWPRSPRGRRWNGDVVLWLDKDGYPVEADAEEFVEAEMLAWPSETKALFTGQYRLEDLRWSGSYTCVEGREYIDVFQFGVPIRVAPDKLEERGGGPGGGGGRGLLSEGWEARGGAPLSVRCVPRRRRRGGGPGPGDRGGHAPAAPRSWPSF